MREGGDSLSFYIMCIYFLFKVKYLKFKDTCNKMCLWYASCANVAGAKDKYLNMPARSLLSWDPKSIQRVQQVPETELTHIPYAAWQLEQPCSVDEALAVLGRKMCLLFSLC